MGIKDRQIKAAMNAMAAKHGDLLDSDTVITEAKRLPKDHPIHERFMGWDESQLATMAARDIARGLISEFLVVQVIRYSTTMEGKAFVRHPDVPGNVSQFIKTTALSRKQAYAVLENEVKMVAADVAAARVRVASIQRFPELVDLFEQRLHELICPELVEEKPKSKKKRQRGEERVSV
jgi:hypothetical protein